MKDLKELYQIKADEIAETKYGVDFYDLPQDVQLAVYREAEAAVADDLAYQADAIRDRIKEVR